MLRTRTQHPSHRTARLTAPLALLLALLGLVALPTPAHAASFSGSLVDAVNAIPTTAEANAGYDRALFPHWIDADGDCQSTRAEVLIAERVTDTPLTYTTSGRCTVATGHWLSYYDRASWTNASDLDIDHMVPLAEAWGSGASGWTTARRQAYANDLGDPRSLVAVTDSVNQSKSDQDPATWLPTYDRCRYVSEWVAVKLRWGLSADSAEKKVLGQYAASCGGTVTVTGA
ncbi:HNH endonuclease family protein [Nocardioides sp. TRM66260-LWL]|uniref:HNH endonuclease family protein n=1 Tax=Nocardioides sp. TRM66260-LWL TaxID=2874478 RepID=UPI001CC7921E|nr:HNH endonuclease family protein [Nocardioides sp. TRM66260-LWL]MBZ5735943.1 HNH endonuclease family protein [Nocardioides sp. TRM66260-LWL]